VREERRSLIVPLGRGASRAAALAAALVTGALLLAPPAPAQETEAPAVSRTGRGFIETPVFTAEEDRALLELVHGLRVADVTDGMDAVGLVNTGLMDPEIHALWKDTERFTHRFIGIAVTARYVPTQRPPAGVLPVKDYDAWAGDWYEKLSPEPFTELIRPGTALVLDDAPRADVGSIGSNNILSWKLRGMVGLVTDATARDTDEIVTERVPLYFRHPGRGIRPGRNEIESVNRPVVVGGVLVVPGDVVVADGDGVLVVPRAVAGDVARYAQRILKGDKEGRRGLYEKLGLPEDPSVE
jgi:4-hydroxy-4-methyl-2-oxoglutarate aldolase